MRQELFSANGYKNQCARDHRKAGVATGTFYLYYPSKEKSLWSFT